MNRLRVLIVDDSADDADLLVDELTQGGYRVEGQRVATEAAMREALQRGAWDLVLCDFTLPTFSGLSALRLARDESPDTPVVVVTGTIGEERLVEAMLCGARDLVLKGHLVRLVPAVARELAAANVRRERRAFEENLQRERERFRALVEKSSDAVAVIDANGTILYASPRTEGILGYPVTEILGTNALELVCLDDLEAARQCLAETTRTTRESRTDEIRCRRKDGEPVWLELSATNLLTDPSICGVVLNFRDVSERKQAESERQREQDLFEKLINFSSDVIYFKDAQSRFVRVNEASARLFGLPPEEVVGKTDFDFFTAEHARQAFADEQEIIRTGTPVIGLEEKETWPDGRTTWVSSTKTPLRDAQGHVTGIIGISRDITKRKESERRLQEQAEALDKANDAIFVTDLQGRITYWNRAAERVFGWSAAEAIGLNTDGLIGIVQESASTAPWHRELRLRNRAEQELVVEASATCLSQEDGQPGSWLMICADITEKKRLEEQFLRAQRLESLGMLAAGIAHDLNNVLAPISMATPLLRHDTTPPEDIRILDTLQQCAQRGAALVRQILGFALGVGGEPRLTQVKHILRDIAQVITETFPKSIGFEQCIPRDLWPILANPTHIHQVVLNLCVNARDAMPRGGRLILRGENCELNAADAQALGGREGAWTVLHIEDTGTGIPPEIRAQIWEPFFSTKPKDKGTGLGLSTVRGIIEAHHGFITLETAEGRGTTFRVYLPATDAVAALEGDAPQTRFYEGRGEIILLVDDEPSIRETAGAILRQAGYQPLAAADGREALDIFLTRSSEIALVVTDIDMPNMSGDALVTAIHAICPGLPILTMSGLKDHQRERSFAGDDFMLKPFTAEKLLEATASNLARRPVANEVFNIEFSV